MSSNKRDKQPNSCRRARYAKYLLQRLLKQNQKSSITVL